MRSISLEVPRYPQLRVDCSPGTRAGVPWRQRGARQIGCHGVDSTVHVGIRPSDRKCSTSRAGGRIAQALFPGQLLSESNEPWSLDCKSRGISRERLRLFFQRRPNAAIRHQSAGIRIQWTYRLVLLEYVYTGFSSSSESCDNSITGPWALPSPKVIIDAGVTYLSPIGGCRVHVQLDNVRVADHKSEKIRRAEWE